MPNLEPIEDKDLDLKNKFAGSMEKAPEEKNAPSVENAPAPENAPERKEGVAEKEEAYSKILSKVKVAKPPSDDSVSTDAQDANSAQSAEAKVEKLVNLAMQKGVVHAVKVARHLEDNYVLDEFHDRLLADELHDALLKKGLIKEI